MRAGIGVCPVSQPSIVRSATPSTSAASTREWPTSSREGRGSLLLSLRLIASPPHWSACIVENVHLRADDVSRQDPDVTAWAHRDLPRRDRLADVMAAARAMQIGLEWIAAPALLHTSACRNGHRNASVSAATMIANAISFNT